MHYVEIGKQQKPVKVNLFRKQILEKADKRLHEFVSFNIVQHEMHEGAASTRITQKNNFPSPQRESNT